MTNALTILTPSDILTTAKALINSGFLPKSVDTVDKAFAIITMSQDLGIGMWQGLNGINVIQGKPTVSPQLMLALINRSGQLEDMAIEATADFARVTLKRKGRTPHTETFTIKDAAAQGLTSKDNYRKQPATMLKWRAVAAACRVVFPDAIMGLYTSEEIAPDAVALTEDGEATYTAPVTVERPAELAPAPQPARVEPAPAADFDRRELHVYAAVRVASKDAQWTLLAYDSDGAEYKVFGLKSRKDLGAAWAEATANWDTTVKARTNLDGFVIPVIAEHEAGAWYFVEVRS